jgi:hypothetical protein
MDLEQPQCIQRAGGCVDRAGDPDRVTRHCQEDTVPIVLALAAVPAMALLLMAVARVETLVTPTDRTPTGR